MGTACRAHSCSTKHSHHVLSKDAVCLICIRNDDAVTEGGDGTLSRLPLRMVTVRDGSAHRCTGRISTPQPGAGAAEVSVAPGLRSPPA